MVFSSFLVTQFHLKYLSISSSLERMHIEISPNCKKYLHVRVLDYVTVVVSGRVGIPLTGLITSLLAIVTPINGPKLG